MYQIFDYWIFLTKNGISTNRDHYSTNTFYIFLGHGGLEFI